KVNAKGVSIYKINGKTVTRETMMEVLRAGNIYPDGHNIILQGDVTEIIEMSSRERREMIDKIAGISEFDQKRDKATKELEIVEKRLTNTAAVLGEKETNIKRLEVERRSAKEYRIQNEELEKLRASLAKIKLKEAEDAMKTLNDKLKETNLAEFDKELDKIDKELESAEKEKNNISKKLLERKDIELFKKIEEIRTEINNNINKVDRDNFEIQRLDEFIRKLEMLQADSGNRVTSAVLKLNRSGVYGSIANLSRVPKEYQTAIEIAAGNHVNDIVTHDKDVAIECLRYLKDNKIGRATFLPLDKIQTRDDRQVRKLLEEDGVVGLAIDLIDFDKKYFNAFSFVLGDTLIVKKIEDARRIGIGKARYVTLDGDLVERSGAIVGGYYRPEKSAFSNSDIVNYSKKKEELKAEIIKLEKEIEDRSKQLRDLENKEKNEMSEFSEFKKATEDIDKKINDLRYKRRTAYDGKAVAESEMNNLRISKAKLEAALDNIRSEFQAYKDKETYVMKPEVLQTKINETLSKINSLGLINMKALEDYDNQKIIYDDLKQKVDKLTEERNKVLSMIGEIENKRMQCFMKTFTSIADHFKIVFNDMTKGVGLLELEDPTDIESGLMIKASPHGKKLENIDALSGGEKTLTALAFLFAIQQFSPAPFYVLDEIDAALDKPNTKKITELIKKYSNKAEFLVISHNDVTIQNADIVYGVSMDKGESNLIAIKMPGV
ncbi:MAG: AAA family ATPase, partial [Candidatus Aenigmarchaeota archaeon]|nr:AAA family ATPase [Candidatus Aenigmarchaeota archaeon]